ncbi:hypothetical protein [Dubosiella newyorkensis]
MASNLVEADLNAVGVLSGQSIGAGDRDCMQGARSAYGLRGYQDLRK